MLQTTEFKIVLQENPSAPHQYLHADYTRQDYLKINSNALSHPSSISFHHKYVYS